MPPQIQQLLENKRMLAIVGGVVALVLILLVVVLATHGAKKEGTARKLNENEKVLAMVESMGKAIEVQALMAREKINLLRDDTVEGGKVGLKFQEDATTDDRDRALITLVQSGLMDKNVGLEMFDKGDLTASREEKRIKLIRARNGELSRLIRKIPPIQDASVFISMPEPTIFKQDTTPVSATIQVTLSSGEKLIRDKVRSIINLMVGSIENLDAKHISLTDTNGTVYNSVLDATDEMMDRLEERDRYMEQKVKEQMDHLIGPGKYVATVSTYLREAPKTEMELNYDPKHSSVSKSARFQENLNAQQAGTGLTGGPVSSDIPDGVDTSPSGSEQSHRGYARTGQEMEYSTGKKQVSQDFVPGMMEEITVAVTVDPTYYPPGMTVSELQTLIARAASPMVKPENVSIVNSKPEEIHPISPPHEPAKFGMPWWLWAIALIVFFLIFVAVMKLFSNKPGIPPEAIQQQQHEIQQLRELTNNQAQQLQMTQQQAQQIFQEQQQQLARITSQQYTAKTTEDAQELKQTLSELQQILQHPDADDEILDDNLGSEIKSWIEST